MRTGSRPSTSSTRTSRTWRTIRPPPRSSSKTVGSVRTGTPRSRHASTTFARSAPDADGIAIRTSSGSTSSRMRPRRSGAAVHAHAADAQAALARIVVHEADRPQAEVGVAHDLLEHEPAALAGADDQHRARVALRAGRADGTLVEQPHDPARGQQ